MVMAGHIPAEKAAESMPCHVPAMMAKNASTESATTPTIMAARTRSKVVGSMFSAALTTPGYLAAGEGILRGARFH